MKFGKKAYASMATAAAFAVGVGGWFLFLSPTDTDISTQVSETSVAVGQRTTVSGAVTPTAADRVVVLEQRFGGGWTEIDRSATDALGEYQFEVPMTDKGKGQVRTRVLEAGRLADSTSEPVAVAVLDPTQLETQVRKFARSDHALIIPGRVTPAAEREVVVETSPDGQTWTQATTTTSSAKSGKFAAQLDGLKPGPVRVRIRVEQSDTAAATVGKASKVSVEDYKAAGKRYLAIVKDANALLTQLNEMSDYLDYTAYQDIYAKSSQARSAEAKAFRQYAYWPREVKANILLLAQSDDLWADTYNQLANAKSSSEFYAISSPTVPKGSDNAPVIIRSALGLPKR